MLGRAGYAVALIDPFERVRRISTKRSRSRTRRRREISKCHSLSIGFDADSASLPFEFLTYFCEDPAQRIAYITLCPLASGLRVNLFSYHQFDDPWLRRFRDEPVVAIAEALPNLERLTGRIGVHGGIKIPPVDLMATENTSQPGIVLVGDAFLTACPVSGTGASKALLDVERLRNLMSRRGSQARVWAPRRSKLFTTIRPSAGPMRIRSGRRSFQNAQRSVRRRSGAHFAGAATPDQSNEILSDMVSCRVPASAPTLKETLHSGI